MHYQQRRGGTEFDGEIAIGDGVELVLADAGNVEFGGDEFAADRTGRAGQRSGAERQDIDALLDVGEAFAVAAGHFELGHQTVAEGHRLGDLQVRATGHRYRDLAFGKVEQIGLASFDDRVAELEANLGGNRRLPASPMSMVRR